VLGRLRIQVQHTPGHTRDSTCLAVEDRVFTGDTLLIGATGRTICRAVTRKPFTTASSQSVALDPALKVFPAHDYKGRGSTTIGQEIANNPRLQKRDRAEFSR